MASKFRKSLVVLALASLLPDAAHAHRQWLLPSVSTVDGREPWVTVDAGVSENLFDVDFVPLKLDGLVITGFAGADKGTRGRVKAFDARDGRLVWTFYTIPGPGEAGHESWPKGSDAWKYGGASVWQTPAIDPELGLVYFSTGNAGPDYNGAVRAGDNLYTVSMTFQAILSQNNLTENRYLDLQRQFSVRRQLTDALMVNLDAPDVFRQAIHAFLGERGKLVQILLAAFREHERRGPLQLARLRRFAHRHDQELFPLRCVAEVERVDGLLGIDESIAFEHFDNSELRLGDVGRIAGRIGIGRGRQLRQLGDDHAIHGLHLLREGLRDRCAERTRQRRSRDRSAR